MTYTLNKTSLGTAMLLLLLTLPGALLPQQARAQAKTEKLSYVSIEAGPAWKLNRVTAPDHHFKNVNALSFTTGLMFRQELIRDVFLAGGICFSPANVGLNFNDSRPHKAVWNTGHDLTIPLQLGYRISPERLMLSFTPYLGYSLLLEQNSVNFDQGGQLVTAAGDRLLYDVDPADEGAPAGLLELGIGAHFRPSGRWQVSLNVSYRSAVFSKARLRHLVPYQDPGLNSGTAEYSDKGNALALTLGLDMPLSNIWQKKDYRSHKRIEQGTFRGKSVDGQGSVYLGAELGLLHRSFLSTSPIVGARPMGERGFFRYSNFHGGLYAGYMFTDALGADLGLNYQRSSTTLAIMSDHENDLALKDHAPMFLEIPLRFRYFYDIYKKQLHLVVYGGPSFLLSFSRGTTGTGSGLSFEYSDLLSGAASPATADYSAERNAILSPLLRMGTGLEYRLPIKAPVTASCYFNYMQGFRTIDRSLVDLAGMDSPHRAELQSRGTGWSLDFGVRIPFAWLQGEDCSATRPDR